MLFDTILLFGETGFDRIKLGDYLVDAVNKGVNIVVVFPANHKTHCPLGRFSNIDPLVQGTVDYSA